MLDIHPLEVLNPAYDDTSDKTQIVLSATGTLQSAVEWAQSPRLPFSLPVFVIDHDGTTYQLFNPICWSQYLGIGDHDINVINVALVNCGPLRRHTDGRFYPIRLDSHSMPIPDTAQPSVRLFYEFCTRHPHHGFTHYELITPAQLRSLADLLPFLLTQYSISYRFDPLTGGVTPDFRQGRPGIYLACGIDGHRPDLHPQPELIRLLKTLSD